MTLFDLVWIVRDICGTANDSWVSNDDQWEIKNSNTEIIFCKTVIKVSVGIALAMFFSQCSNINNLCRLPGVYVISLSCPFRLTLSWVLRSCLNHCIFADDLWFLITGLSSTIQTHQRRCFLIGAREELVIKIWLKTESHPGFESGLPCCIRNGGSQMTTVPLEWMSQMPLNHIRYVL